MLVLHRRSDNGKSEVLIHEDFINLPSGSYVVGYAYLRGYSEQPTKNGGTFLAGQLDVMVLCHSKYGVEIL